jgi:hypothetical protein
MLHVQEVVHPRLWRVTLLRDWRYFFFGAAAAVETGLLGAFEEAFEAFFSLAFFFLAVSRASPITQLSF